MKEFKPYPFIKELFIPKKDLPEYYVKKRAYYLEKNPKKIATFKKQEKLHNFFMRMFSLNRRYIDKQNYTIINDEREEDMGNVIYAVTHIGKFDYQILTEALNTHTIPFAGDPELAYRNFDGFIFNTNGVVYIDTESKTDRKVAYETAIEVLKNGYNLMIFPEGIWNLSANNLVQPIYPGVIKMAQESGKKIVPVAIEQYGSDFVINIGKPIEVNPSRTDEVVEKEKQTLRDVLATLKYQIMEVFPKKLVRKELGDFEELNDEFVNTRLNEYVNPKTKQNYFTEEFVENRVYKVKGVSKPKDAFSYIKRINPNSNNAFIFRKDDSIPSEIYDELYESNEECERGRSK